MKKPTLILISFFIFFLAVPFGCFARDLQDISDWYIKSFNSTIKVEKDSSLLITEKIIADCGYLPGKHGIFRVLPQEIKTDKGTIKNPVELISITDFSGKPYNYQEIKDNFLKTITWKIGDADKTVLRENDYKIIYKIKNAVRSQEDFDELYWNLSGNYWEIDIDSFSAEIIFPEEINSQNSEIYYYTGFIGQKNTDLAVYEWTSANTLKFTSTKRILPGQGITVSVTFPKDIFTPYIPSFWEKYGGYFIYLLFLIPVAVFIYTYSVWRKYGKDIKMKKPIPPEFEIPDNITPIQMGMVLRNGWRNNFITAALVDLAVKKYIRIEEVKEDFIILKINNYKLVKAENYGNINQLPETEKNLLVKIFSGHGDSVKLSQLREDRFYEKAKAVKKMAGENAYKKWLVEKSAFLSTTFYVCAAVPFFFSIWGTVIFANYNIDNIGIIFLSLFASTIIFIVFGAIMPKRTQEGVDLLFKIKGFERYMKQAEDYRQQFYEKENIFDKFLPYAIVFGITDLWVKKMQKIYGEDFYKNYHPVWLAGSYTNFDLNSFSRSLNSITTAMSSNTSTSSGSHGGGSSGGGGGGGGGGGW